MKLFTDSDLEAYVNERVVRHTQHLIDARKEAFDTERDRHEWQMRRTEAEKSDAETERDRYRGGYKRALKTIKGLRIELSEAKRQLLAAGLSTFEGPDKDGGPPKLNSVQGVMDRVSGEIPQIDDAARSAVRLYVEREMRTRGSSDAEEILAEVVAGGFMDDD